MKKITLFILLWCVIHPVFARQANPDTLVIGTKKGKIILVSDSLPHFNALNANELITKALYQVRDSLTLEEKKAVYKKLRANQYSRIVKNKFPFRILPVVGLGLVREKISPFLGLSLDFAPQRQDYYFKKGGEYTFINVAFTPYFTFEKDNTNTYITNRNLFMEASLGNRINNANNYGMFSEISAGLGYLIHRSGNYFDKNTFKIFVTIGIKNSFVKVKPELLFTGDFKTAFPGMGIKIF